MPEIVDPCDIIKHCAPELLDRAGIGTWVMDPARRSLTFSKVAKALLGATLDGDVGYESFLSFVDARDRAQLGAAIQRSLNAGVPLDIQCRIHNHGPSRRVRIVASLVNERPDKPALTGMLLDIEKDNQIEESERHLRLILDTIPDAMIVIDQQGIMQFFSSAAERQFGYSASEAIGKNVSVLMPEPDRTRHDGYVARYQATGERRIIGIGRVVTGQRKDGTTFPMHLTVGEMSSGDEPYFTGFVRDLTEQQQTQARLQELQSELVHISRLSAMGEMASALAHELNQPLSAISNYMKGSRRLLAESSDPKAEQIMVALERAADQAIRAGQIIRRLRSFVARDETEKRIESLSKLMEEAGALGLTGAREQDVRIRFKLDPKHDAVLADRVQIQQVLVNLFRNALEAMANSATRELVASNTATDDDMIEITVSDTGQGFDADVMSNLFQPFFTTKETGMGVGLSISRTIIEAHGGRMWAENNMPSGATFHFTLPSATEKDVANAGQ
ncbi:MAG: PAS domain S-box protein [Xanthobacteraceae bacterium]|nr:PAS domain S-box protein [Xanthobacteraceae bacterium]